MPYSLQAVVGLAKRPKQDNNVMSPDLRMSSFSGASKKSVMSETGSNEIVEWIVGRVHRRATGVRMGVALTAPARKIALAKADMSGLKLNGKSAENNERVEYSIPKVQKSSLEK
jgi:hypothetical protein